jgi:ornithine carbamoyltransferase
MDLKGRSLLALKDYTAQEIRHLLDLSHGVKRDRRAQKPTFRFQGRTLAMIFEKRSTRTRCAFETAFGEEGGHPTVLSMSDVHLGAKETVEDTARVLGRMFDAIEFRGFSQAVVETLAAFSGVPVYNGLTDQWHPTQALADLMTLEEEFGELRGVSLAYVGDGRNNVASSLLVGCAKMGVRLTVATPASLQPSESLMGYVREEAGRSGSRIAVEGDPRRAVEDADAVYTDVWVSMGEESQEDERVAILGPYQVNRGLMAATGKARSIFLHCLPAVRGNEVTSDVLDGGQSRAFEEAENRKHTIKAVMLATLGLD